MPKYAKTQPTAMPTHASIRLSMSSCRTSRPRLAPSDVLSASSRCRPAARLSSMFATLAHAMSSSNPTAAAIV